MVNQDFGWRVEWALRSGLGVAVLGGVLLFTDLYQKLQFHVPPRVSEGISPGGPCFAGFICSLVMDVNFGRTLINAWNVALVTVPCLLLCVAPLVAGADFSRTISLPVLAASTFLVSMLNLHPVGKRVGLSVLPMCLMQSSRPLLIRYPFAVMANTMFGLAVAFAGVLLPWPKIAPVELHARMSYTAGALSQVLHSLVAGLRGDCKARLPRAMDHRAELLRFVQANVVTCTTRIVEARFGPQRSCALNSDAALLRTLDELLMSVQVMNAIFGAMDFENHPTHDMLMSKIRPELAELESALVAGLQLVEGSSSRRGEEEAQAADRLRKSADALDRAFHETRRRLYFDPASEVTMTMIPQAVLALNAILFELDVVVGILWTYLADRGSILKGKRCCRGTLAADLFPSQRHLLGLLRWPWTPAAVRQVIVSFKLTLAIMIAAVYGYWAFDTPNFLAAYTIAYVGVDTAHGSNVSFFLLRAGGTVTASVYCILVVMVSQHFAEVGQRLWVLAAMVAWVMPATYMRSSPQVSYGGTVAAFTAVLLLLEVPNGLDHAHSQSLERVHDTFVGVFIFLVVEIFIYPMRSESQLYAKVGETLRAVRSELLGFGKTFASELGAAAGFANGHAPPSGGSTGEGESSDSGGGTPGSGGEVVSGLGLPAPRPAHYILQDLPSHADRMGLILAQQQLLLHSQQEPVFWRTMANQEYLKAVLDVEVRLLRWSLQMLRITQHAITARSRLLVPAVFAELQDPKASTQVMLPMHQAFEEMLSGLPSWVDHLLAGVAELDKSVGEGTLTLAGTGCCLEDDCSEAEGLLRADGRAIAEAEAQLLARWAAHLRRLQDGLRSPETAISSPAGAGSSSGASPAVPTNAEIKLVSALLYGARGVLAALRDLEAPLVRAQAARVLSAKQHPLIRRRRPKTCCKCDV